MAHLWRRLIPPGRLLALLEWVLAYAISCAPGLAGAGQAEEWRNTIRAAEYDARQLALDAERSLIDARSRGDEARELKALVQLSTGRLFLADRFEHTDRGLMLARKLGNVDAQCWFLQVRTVERLASSNGALKAGLAVDSDINEAVVLAIAHDLKFRLAWLYADKSQHLLYGGKRAQAMEILGKAYSIFEALDDKYGMARSIAGFGALYGGMDATAEDQAKAADYFSRALSLIDAKVYRRLAAQLHLAHGLAHYRRQEVAQARLALERAMSLAGEIKYAALQAMIHGHLARFAVDEAKYSEALERLDYAIPILSAGNADHPHIVRALFDRAAALAGLGRRDESLVALATALGRIEAFGPNASIEEGRAFLRASQTHALLGNYSEAYQFMGKVRRSEQRAAEVANARRADELKVRFGVELREAENALLHAQKREEQTRRQVLALALATSLLCLMLVVSLALYLRRRAAAARQEAKHHEALAVAESAANRAKSAFLSNMSHELRSPLNSILGFARLGAAQPGISPRLADDLRIIVNSGEHLHSLVNQVLDLSKIEAGRMGLNEGDLDLHVLLTEMSDLFNHAARRKGLDLTVGCDVPPRIRADVTRLRQVLINLLDNAIKFTARGGVTLKVVRTECDSGSDKRAIKLTFSVTDTGPGIAEAELEEIGQAFVQATAGKQSGEGTGLGLTLCRSAVTLMGGTLKISSRVGVGTTIAFDMPAGKPQGNPDTSGSAGHDPRIVTTTAGAPGCRVLVVDDRPESRQLIARVLAPLGFELREAADGQEAINVSQTWLPRMILMDMRMPIMDGTTATRFIKRSGRRPAPVIIALTASSCEEERDQILADGFDDYLRKPFHEGDLVRVMLHHLNSPAIQEDVSAVEVPAELDGSTIQRLPLGIRVNLEKALTSWDLAALDEAIKAVSVQAPDFGEKLAALAGKFQYNRMLDALRAIDVEPQAEDHRA